MDPLGLLMAVWPFALGLVLAFAVFAVFLIRAVILRKRAKRRAVGLQADVLLGEIQRIEIRFRKESPVLLDDILRGFVVRAGQEAQLVLDTAQQTIGRAMKLARRSPDGAEKILREVSASIATTEGMFRVMDEAVREIRTLARGLLGRVEGWWAEMLDGAAGHLMAGRPVAEEAMRLTAFRLAFAADGLLVESDPFGVLKDLTSQVERLARIAHVVAVTVAVCERISESAAALPPRLAEIDRSLPVALEALAALQVARPDRRWDEIDKALRSFPGEFDGLRMRLNRAEALSQSYDHRFAEALRETVLAEETLAGMEGHISAVLEQWSGLRRVHGPGKS